MDKISYESRNRSIQWIDRYNGGGVYITFNWMTCSFIWLKTLQFKTRKQKWIWMGITILNIFIWVGISSLYGRKSCFGLHLCVKVFERISDDIPPQMKILINYPLNHMCWFIFVKKKNLLKLVAYFNTIPWNSQSTLHPQQHCWG